MLIVLINYRKDRKHMKMLSLKELKHYKNQFKSSNCNSRKLIKSRIQMFKEIKAS